MESPNIAWKIVEITAVIAGVLGGGNLIYSWSRGKVSDEYRIKYSGALLFTSLRYLTTIAIIIYMSCAMLRIGASKPIFQEEVVTSATEFIWSALLLLLLALFWLVTIDRATMDAARNEGKGIGFAVLFLLVFLVSAIAYAMDTYQVFSP